MQVRKVGRLLTSEAGFLECPSASNYSLSFLDQEIGLLLELKVPRRAAQTWPIKMFFCHAPQAPSHDLDTRMARVKNCILGPTIDGTQFEKDFKCMCFSDAMGVLLIWAT